MIHIENLTKSYGAQVLLDNVSFKLNTKERLGLVGRNGHGKTTLFRLITGEETPDSGLINIPRHYRIHFVRQTLSFSQPTVLKEGMLGLTEPEEHLAWRVEKVLAGLGFSPKDMHRHPSEFSGGYQVRLNLAKALISEPDLLLLDEPTNYLDITAIRWIRRFLMTWQHELMLITHDRGFMDSVVTHTMGIHRRKLRKISGNTQKYYHQIAKDEEIYEKTRIKDERRRKEIQQYIARFRAKARLANLVQSRIKTLAKMEKKEIRRQIKTLDFAFRCLPFAGKQVIRVQGLGFGYHPNEWLFRDLEFTITAGDRVGIVGPNGKGKTTLIKLLAGILTPRIGTISLNPNVKMGTFEQTHVDQLVPQRTVEEEIQSANPDADRQQVRNACGAMMFSGDDALKKISVLSGGEKSRVMLAKLLVTPVNVLLLDEPTNHLDMESCDALLAALDNFEGTVIMVTHNELFLQALTNRLVVFHLHGTDVVADTYQRFLDAGGWGDVSEELHQKQDASASDQRRLKLNKKELRRRRSEIVTERGQMIRPLEKRIAQIEDIIDALERELASLNLKMQTATRAQNGDTIATVSVAIHRIQNDIDARFDELESATGDLEKWKATYEKRLALLDANLH